MAPQEKMLEKERTEEAHLQEQYIRQVEDKSKPAHEVLSDQQEGRARDDSPALFVP